MQKILFIILTILLVVPICMAQEQVSPEVGNILKQAHEYSDQGNVEKALTFLDESLLKYKEKTFDRYSLLNYKYDLLSKTSRYQEAVEVCVEKANIVTSPRQAFITAQAFLKINDKQKAIEWLETSVSRGLQSYTIFDDDIYKPLRGNSRFEELAEIVKKKNGLGLPPKPFVSKTISGKEVALEMYKGKVLLLDFWATWCPPCRAEMPNVIKCYSEFKDKGLEIIGFANENYSETLTDYLKTNKINWPIVSIDKGNYKELAIVYSVTNIPASFLIDKKGIVRHINLTGDKLWNAIAELVKE